MLPSNRLHTQHTHIHQHLRTHTHTTAASGVAAHPRRRITVCTKQIPNNSAQLVSGRDRARKFPVPFRLALGRFARPKLGPLLIRAHERESTLPKLGNIHWGERTARGRTQRGMETVNGDETRRTHALLGAKVIRRSGGKCADDAPLPPSNFPTGRSRRRLSRAFNIVSATAAIPADMRILAKLCARANVFSNAKGVINYLEM